MVEFDSFLVTHGPETKVDVQDLSEKIIGKRKFGGKAEIPFKRTKYPAYFIYDLAHVVAFADEQIPFNTLASEMTKKGIAHSGTHLLKSLEFRPGNDCCDLTSFYKFFFFKIAFLVDSVNCKFQL